MLLLFLLCVFASAQKVVIGPKTSIYMVYNVSRTAQCKADVVTMISHGTTVDAGCESSQPYWEMSDATVEGTVLRALSSDSSYTWPSTNKYLSSPPFSQGAVSLFSRYSYDPVWGWQLQAQSQLELAFNSSSACGAAYASLASNCTTITVACSKQPSHLIFFSQSGGCNVPFFSQWPLTVTAAQFSNLPNNKRRRPTSPSIPSKKMKKDRIMIDLIEKKEK